MTANIDNPPLTRPSAADVPNGPIPLFDAQLKVLTDSYLNFFQERRRIEQIYTESLRRLYEKARSIDTYLDDRNERSTTRIAWSEVRENLDREVQSRVAFAHTLTTDVINPLTNLKETQERIRKRIREDLKDAISAHTEYSENVYPKLKRAYLKKSQEVEDYKAAAAAERSPLSPTTTAENPFVSPRSSVSSGRPVVTAPQPLRPLERRASGTIPATRNRSPSSSTALHDIASQGKKQLNQLMTFLDKNNVKDALAGRSDNALRSVRAKREADEADKEYRKAVHWLETLRLRRVKILESGYNSMESFLRENSITVKQVLKRYLDNMLATASTQTGLCNRVLQIVERINPEKDASSIASQIPQLLAQASPKPQYYYNYTVGECRDLIFGVSLVDYATSRGLSDGEIPKIVKICINEIENRGMDAEGIYRVSGRHAAVTELQHKIERNEATFMFQAPHDDVYAVASLLKLYLRELPEPVFKFPLQDRIAHTDEIEDQISKDFQLLRGKIRRLPPIHQATLKAIVEHLARVASHSEKNKMDAKNLAIVFGSVIFGEDDLPKAAGDLLNVQSWKDTLMEDLITHANILFSNTQSPPLPPAPLDEPALIVSYGSSHTKVSQVPPRAPTPLKDDDGFVVPPLPPRPVPSNSSTSKDPANSFNDFAPELPPRPANSIHHKDTANSSNDFAPRLPPRPADSIHPSLRSGPMSSSPARQSLPPPQKPPQWFDENVPFAPQSATSRYGPVPPSPTKSEHRRAPSNASLPSPWSDREPIPPGPSVSSSSKSSLAFPSLSTTEAEDEEDPPIPVIPDPDESPSPEPFSPSTFETAPTSATSATSIQRPPSTPPPAPAKDVDTRSGSRSTTVSPSSKADENQTHAREKSGSE
ncbi:RhoGAP-domain-containing protein [Panus rudis PR-1116 ss-1]|nr:RhoGAP-domain-containing protein [Panus rudis PR-1116 ss-1]